MVNYICIGILLFKSRRHKVVEKVKNVCTYKKQRTLSSFNVTYNHTTTLINYFDLYSALCLIKEIVKMYLQMS